MKSKFVLSKIVWYMVVIFCVGGDFIEMFVEEKYCSLFGKEIWKL